MFKRDAPRAFAADADPAAMAAALVGVTVAALESLVKLRAHEGRTLAPADWVEAKKQPGRARLRRAGRVHRADAARSTSTTDSRR